MMLNPRSIKNVSFYFSFLVLYLSSGLLFAQEKGQIININQNYQIAFTDLGNNLLKQGDIVKVSLNTDEFVYMQVLEASPILSKLGPSQMDKFRTNLKDFQSMAVGDTVVKVNQSLEKVDASTSETSDTNVTVDLSGLQIEKLEKDLALAKEEIKRLEESNEESKAKVNELVTDAQAKSEVTAAPVPTESKDILGQLKAHLDNMRKLIDENN